MSAAVVLLGATGQCELAPPILDACSTRTNIEVAMDTVCAMGSAVVLPLLREIYRVGIESRGEAVGAGQAREMAVDSHRGSHPVS